MYNIIIVDDEREILDVLSKTFSRNKDFNVTTYSNPISAVSAISSKKPDIVLTDIMMPEMDGIQLLEKTKEVSSDTIVVIMTAYSTLDKVLKSHSQGAEHYVMKPFESLKAVESKVLSLLKK